MSQSQEPAQPEVVFGEEVHSSLLVGAEILFNAVKSTMGPSGHGVIIDTGTTAPIITKDGVTVAKSINLKAKLPGIGAELIKEVASKTNEQAGDGTTTATVLAYALLKQGIKMMSTGRNPVLIKQGMDLAVSKVVEWLSSIAVPLRDSTDVVNIGTISANGDKAIGELISAAIEKVGQDGIITIEPARSVKTTLDVVDGTQFDTGYVSPYFVTNQEKLTCELNEPYVLITSKKLSSLQELVPVLEQVANANKPLLIIADEVEGEALHTLIVNKMKNIVQTCAVKAPGYGENRIDLLGDIALVTGGTVIDASSTLSLRTLTLQQLGKCKKVLVSRGTTTVVGDVSHKQAIADKVASLRAQTEDPTVVHESGKLAHIKRRLAKLAGGVAVIKVGGSTEIEILEKKDRVEDALNATVAAVQEGLLPGGGVALFHASEHLLSELKTASVQDLHDDIKAGIVVVAESCRYPLQVIVENTGKSPDVVMDKLLSAKKTEGVATNYGYDARSHTFCDLVEAGIIDPAKVERCALEHACSVVGLMLTTNCIVLS